MTRVFQTATWRKLQWPLLALALVLLFNFAFTKDFFELTVPVKRPWVESYFSK